MSNHDFDDFPLYGTYDNMYAGLDDTPTPEYNKTAGGEQVLLAIGVLSLIGIVAFVLVLI